MTPPPPETSDERRLQDDAEKRVYESKVCSRFSTAMGQPHCQTCGRNEDLHTIRGLLKALAAERSSREAHALPREVQAEIEKLAHGFLLDAQWDAPEPRRLDEMAERYLESAVRLGLAQQAGERARLREALRAKAEGKRASARECDAIAAQASSEDYKEVMMDEANRFRAEANELDALLTAAPAAAGSAGQEDIKRLYYELLFEVARKHPGESRHQTALRYIRQAEAPTNNAQCEAS